ncbi:mannosyltransferase family protein [Actinosynnema sp. NPDC004786]
MTAQVESSATSAVDAGSPEVTVAATAGPVADRRPSRARRALSSDWARTFALVFAWHAVLTAVAVLFQGALPVDEGYPVRVLGPDATLLSHTFRWDSESFGNIADGGYVDPRAPWLTAFYPVFPLLVWLVQAATFGLLGPLAAGMAVNGVATWLAATALLRIARHFPLRESAAWLVVVAFLTAPAAFFLHAFYSEAVFCALGFWAYLFALRRRWGWMALCLVPLTATRITAALFVGLCALEFFRSREWRPRGLLSWRLLLFPAAFLGFALYALHLWLVKDDALAMMHAYDGVASWAYHVLNPNIVATLSDEVSTSWRALASGHPDGWQLMSHILPLTGLAVLVAASVYVVVALRRDGLPLAGFGLASFVMLTLNSNVVSVHRYLVPCLVIYLAMVLAAERRPALRPVLHGSLYASTLVQGSIYLLFVAGFWAG